MVGLQSPLMIEYMIDITNMHHIIFYKLFDIYQVIVGLLYYCQHFYFKYSVSYYQIFQQYYQISIIVIILSEIPHTMIVLVEPQKTDKEKTGIRPDPTREPSATGQSFLVDGVCLYDSPMTCHHVLCPVQGHYIYIIHTSIQLYIYI